MLKPVNDEKNYAEQLTTSFNYSEYLELLYLKGLIS